MHYIDVAKLVKSIQYRSLLAASTIAIVWTAPVWAHAPEYHAPSEQEEVSSPAPRLNPTPESTPNSSESETNSQTKICTAEETCSTDLQTSPAEKKSASSLPTDEFVLLLLAIGPFVMVSFKQRWQHNHK